MKISKIDKILNYIENNYEIELNFETLFYKLDKFYNKNKQDTKTLGKYHTPILLFDQLCHKFDIIKRIQFDENTKILDFCCGTGNLYFVLLDLLNNIHINMNIILYNIHLIDIDEFALKILKIKLYCWIKINNLEINVIDLYENIKCYDCLLEISDDTKYDFIITNPPFVNLKSNKEYKTKLRNLDYYKYSLKQCMNTYTISIERMIRILNKNGNIIIICPKQILTNKTNTCIRDFILTKCCINNIVNIDQKNRIFIDAKIDICIIDLTKNNLNKQFHYLTCNYKNNELVVLSDNIIIQDKLKILNNNIVNVTEIDMRIIESVRIFKKIKDFKQITNRRGNIDLTQNKKYISNEVSKYPLVRGRNISNLSTIDEYISEEIIHNKKINIKDQKLVSNQISNSTILKRINYRIVPKNYVISNSCNYILVENQIQTLQFILNSLITNYYFNIFSGNNHISNHEIDNLYIPDIFQNNININSNFTQYEIERKICNLYNFDEDLIQYLFNHYKIQKPPIITNHIFSKMSDMEQKMAKYISIGGNWKNIPENNTESKRLNTIRKTGGRTTLYGRLHYDKPSYTITTHFHRFPNGTNLHPTKNRTLTIREAALLQSFPINYKFSVKKNVAITQIGNAVPPLLAYHIGKHLFKHIKNKKTLDLFAGVGGMATGLIKCGYNVILSNEYDKKIANESNINHPSVKHILGDICDKDIKKQIIDYGNSNEIGLIVGGPPCQGMSGSGKRKVDDKRNKLYLEYFKVIEEIKPEAFVMENVVGLLSMKKENGTKIIDHIKEIVNELGYQISIWKLHAINYGIPQKRVRVFVIGHKEKTFELPSPLFGEKGSGLPYYTTVGDAIKFLEHTDETFECFINKNKFSKYNLYLNGDITFEEFYRQLS
tara:strand:+ start:1371 stop:4037 length:2667 start_codon:yes stop_codon:yes gene_type:complete